jgi:hypothetical protein
MQACNLAARAPEAPRQVPDKQEGLRWAQRGSPTRARVPARASGGWRCKRLALERALTPGRHQPATSPPSLAQPHRRVVLHRISIPRAVIGPVVDGLGEGGPATSLSQWLDRTACVTMTLTPRGAAAGAPPGVAAAAHWLAAVGCVLQAARALGGGSLLHPLPHPHPNGAATACYWPATPPVPGSPPPSPHPSVRAGVRAGAGAARQGGAPAAIVSTARTAAAAAAAQR